MPGQEPQLYYDHINSQCRSKHFLYDVAQTYGNNWIRRSPLVPFVTFTIYNRINTPEHVCMLSELCIGDGYPGPAGSKRMSA